MTPTAFVAMGFALFVSSAALVWAAVSDVRYYQIPNGASAAVAGAFLLMAAFMRASFLFGGLAVGVGVFAVCTVLFARRMIGGGDVKLMTAVGFWCGPALLTQFALVTSLAGAALAVVMLSPIARRLPAPPCDGWVPVDPGAGVMRQPVPFAVAIAAGGLWVLTRYVTLVV